ncbi:MAG: hypothetical protein LBG27_01325 [Spirochaetaceae bacterium]|nr:hypothetical protein [Spirochaetaceae bacterium]
MESLGIVAMETNGRLTENIAWAAIRAIEEMDAEVDAGGMPGLSRKRGARKNVI